MTAITKNRITFTVTVEYVVNPDNYPGYNTDEERLALDVKNAKNDPFIMLGDDAEWSIVGEVVK